jgi:hypothetical protein
LNPTGKVGVLNRVFGERLLQPKAKPIANRYTIPSKWKRGKPSPDVFL